MNPAPGDEIGSSGSENAMLNPGSCVDFRSTGPFTVRDCTFLNDNDTLSALNEVCLHFDHIPSGGESTGPVLVENCSFRSTNGNIRFTHRAQNITIRGCNFSIPDIDNARDGTAAATLCSTWPTARGST